MFRTQRKTYAPPLLIIPLASLAETVATVVVTTIAAKFASDVYDAVTNCNAATAGPSLQDVS